MDNTNILPLTMIRIPGGEFFMGNPYSEPMFKNEHPLHKVCLDTFYMSKYLITQAQWMSVTKLPKVGIDLPLKPSSDSGSNLPVVNINWNEAMEFCNRLCLHSGKKYSLPSEAQWEYACRAGTRTKYYYGKEYDSSKANFNDVKTTVVNEYPPNPWRLHDMLGNVWEWCLDDWHDDYVGAPQDGSAWTLGGKNKVLRGGDYLCTGRYCTASYRVSEELSHSDFSLGFRVVNENL